jgi:hypothetical protein
MQFAGMMIRQTYGKLFYCEYMKIVYCLQTYFVGIILCQYNASNEDKCFLLTEVARVMTAYSLLTICCRLASGICVYVVVFLE